MREKLPQTDPFVFVDSASISEQSAEGRYLITGEECFMAGHFPNRPVFPASILVEALGQLAIAYMRTRYADLGILEESIFFIKSEDVACRRQCVPGDELELKIVERQMREPLMTFKGLIAVKGELAVKVSSIALSFECARS